MKEAAFFFKVIILVLKYSINDLSSKDRDYFILSKGHGCLALYVVLEKFGFIGKKELSSFSKHDSLLGEHPDCLKVPGIEASPGSLGHGLPFSVGIALGLKINKMPNKVIVLIYIYDQPLFRISSTSWPWSLCTREIPTMPCLD